MPDKQKAFLITFGYFFFWLLAIIQYFVIVGIMYLMTIVIPSDTNIWLVGLIIVVLIYVHKLGKVGTKSTIEKMEDKL